MPSAATAQRLPETMNVHEIGAQLAALRGQFGLTVQEVSARLHIRARYIHAMEEGKFDLLPGKVYARGYLHTYAEFLGLDAAQVVALSFAGEPPVNAQKPKAPSGNLDQHVQYPWRNVGVVAVAMLVVLVIFGQFGAHTGDEATRDTAIAPVPDSMLQTVRTMVMPTPMNYNCVAENTPFACMLSDPASQKLAALERIPNLRFVGDIDVSEVILLPPPFEEIDALPEVSEGIGEEPLND